MTYNILATPLLPSISRYKKLFFGKTQNSLTRTLQYEYLSHCTFKGKMLDFGGGEKAKYRHILHIQSKDYHSINIDPEMRPTWVNEVGKALPLSSKQEFDIVFSLNTFEHIYAPYSILNQLCASLKSGGKFVCSVPFLYPVHAHPDDFFRPTASWWYKALNDAGFQDIRVTPLVWGPFSTGFTASGGVGPFKKIRLHFNMLLDILYTKYRFRKQSPSEQKVNYEQLSNHSVGFFVEAIKG